MQLTIDFKDALWPEILASFCAQQGYQVLVVQDGETIRNPQSKEDFVIEAIRDFVQSNYLNGKVEEQVEAVRQQERDKLK